jgi:hypothetical protein
MFGVVVWGCCHLDMLTKRQQHSCTETQRVTLEANRMPFRPPECARSATMAVLQERRYVFLTTLEGTL